MNLSPDIVCSETDRGGDVIRTLKSTTETPFFDLLMFGAETCRIVPFIENSKNAYRREYSLGKEFGTGFVE